jgi:ferric-dicitrate binding protein FerR (iron transport regulator)
MNERLDLAIAAYHDGTLDAASSQLLVEALRGSDAAAVRECIAFDGLLGQAFTADEAVERSVRERIEGERSASAVVRAVRGSLATTTRRQRRVRRIAWLPRVAVAALLLVVVGVGWWLSARTQPRPGECRLEASAPLTITRGGTSISIASGGSLIVGDRLTASVSATLVWPDGSRLALAPDTQVDLTRPALGPGCRLEQGTATAEIAPQRPGLPFTIATPEARIEVLGTRFQVVAGTRRTQVDLQEGIVRLTRSGDGRALTMRANESAVVASDEEFVVHSTAAVTPPVATTTSTQPAPAEPAWTALFATTGLDGWVQQHGAWSNLHGVIRGNDPHLGKARLLGSHPFADLELSCRLRITGVKAAEVQVGDYNWFVEVPANGAEWVQVELRQRSDHLTVTADGIALTLHPGDGATAMRPGPLAFYVMPGGTLEISDAKFRIPPIGTSTTR